ncbi:MAG TPA: condensation domain-containing protein, partial [Thermoanaerobaculia bacterium]|nr:condensation domain-containing protein [Thermoanaerobaculia bacterium]
MQDERVQGFRLSPQQRRLWWLRQDAVAGSAAFRVQAIVRITTPGGGDLDSARLWFAVRRVAAGTEILRTCFQSLAGMGLPLQVVREELPPCLLERDLSGDLDGLAADQKQSAIDALLREEWEAPWSPESDTPLRALLLTLDPGVRLLAVTLPGLCADRAGVANLV